MLLNMDILLEKLDGYIEENYQAPANMAESDNCMEKNASFEKSGESGTGRGRDLQDIIKEVGETFHEFLFRKIEERGMTPAEVYHKANMDRKLFSKIRNNPAYHPSKSRVLDLAIAMRLTEQETVDLLSRAEYAFSPSSKRDLIIRFFIEKGIYDQETINYALVEYGEDILGDQQTRRTRE